jgi:recombination protein RecA
MKRSKKDITPEPPVVTEPIEDKENPTEATVEPQGVPPSGTPFAMANAMSRIAQTMSKQFGDKSMLFLKEHPDYAKVKNWVSTQNYALDWILSGKADGTGGLPVERVIELFGDPSSGKSLILAHILAEAQRRGGIPVLYDVEATFDMYFAQRIGLDINNLLYTKAYENVKRNKKILVEKEVEVGGKKQKKMVLEEQKIDIRIPSTVERMQEMMENLIDVTYHEYPGILLVIGLDSVAGLSTEHELDEPDKRDFTKAQGIRKFVKMMEAKMADQNCMLVVTNHVTAKLDMKMPWERQKGRKQGPKEDKNQPGGSGLPFGSSVRVDLTRGTDIEEGIGNVTGHQIYVFSHKNKVWSPHKQTVVEMKFDSGLDRYSGLLEVLIKKDVIEDMGDQVFRYKGQRFKKKPQERPRFIGLAEVIDKNPELLSLANEV